MEDKEEIELSEFALAIRRINQTEDGKFIIDELQRLFVNKRYMAEIGVNVDVGNFLSFKEGQKDVAMYFMDAINAKTGEQK